ncbi:MAG: hypothetical protein HS100_22515 [Anaerolineales bacterium]|nr:MAG: hypothetical protein EDM79_07690 [Chloroflexota bacterium]MBE7436704.1 hypothetical protein [Anaerolineales bacterium]MCE7858862.1 hypothetical protein [Chloroflexi bacterium CFX2]GJQ37231.1 MAG: hypothetical protein JETCAE01_32410 [Anaerolineaceae bacterium]
MQFIVAFLKKIPILPIVLFILGLGLGLVIGWWIAPVEFVNATPYYLRQDLREDYMRMAIDSYSINKSAALAADRWIGLGTEAQNAFAVVQNNPGYLPSSLIQEFGQAVTDEIKARGEQPVTEEPNPTPGWLRLVLIGIGILLVLGVALAAGFYMFRLFRKRGSGEVTVTMQATEISRTAAKTNFEEMGLAPPITQTMTTYVLGDDLYDESFSIDTGSGEFLGEYGVGVSEIIGVGEPKKVTALEIWLFDKNDIKTATKVLMSRHAFADPGIRSRLEPKGELVMMEPQAQILLETATLQLLATIVDIEYGKGVLPDGSFFERVTLELAIWPRQG